ncbi:hypothetical protein BDV93DRAFT_565841 [Ceratobasidium sp. AG-I]|nr:hypothetical protein BDV93DRAFT_565841 [Ceratobasidium sp. AG-I]
MLSTKVKTKSGATVPATDRRTATRTIAEEAPGEKPKSDYHVPQQGEITEPNG